MRVRVLRAASEPNKRCGSNYCWGAPASAWTGGAARGARGGRRVGAAQVDCWQLHPILPLKPLPCCAGLACNIARPTLTLDPSQPCTPLAPANTAPSSCKRCSFCPNPTLACCSFTLPLPPWRAPSPARARPRPTPCAGRARLSRAVHEREKGLAVQGFVRLALCGERVRAQLVRLALCTSGRRG